MRNRIMAVIWGLMALIGTIALGEPFNVSARVTGEQVEVDVQIENGYYLYVDKFKVSDAEGNAQQLLGQLETDLHHDPLSGADIQVYEHSFTALYSWAPAPDAESVVRVKYQGCSNDGFCLPPKTKQFLVTESAVPETDAAEPSVPSASWQEALDRFTVAGNASGYMKPKEFIRFIDDAESGVKSADNTSMAGNIGESKSLLGSHGIVWVVLFILIGGIALNFTPCVLPMIPVNLTVIGAGAQAGSKGRGFALGAVYGLGIALAYGVLGVIVVLTGAGFGSIQANPWFNLIITLVFVVLSLAMFDVFQIDFSRFQSKLGNRPQKAGRFSVAFSMGVVAALLAGACVAPVVTSVLLFAQEIYETSKVGGLLLPFVLGIGMALPWPFAGAGLSFLPKPGSWMQYVKYALGIGILFMAFHYGKLSYHGFKPVELPRVESGHQQNDHHIVIDGRTHEGFAEVLDKAYQTKQSVFIDVTASWCKNCQAMKKKTFPDKDVQQRLSNYVFIEYVSEEPGNANTKVFWERFNIIGPPVYLVLTPNR